MQRFITDKELQTLRVKFPAGTRVKLVKMDDPYQSKPAPGDTGTVIGVDDIGTIHVHWDCGSSLGVAFGEDIVTRI